MTSPFILKQNQQKLQAQGTSPIVLQANALLDPGPTKLAWQQNDQARSSQQQAISQAIQDRQIVPAAKLDTTQFQNRLTAIKNIGQTATAGTIASIQTQQAAANSAFQQQQSALSGQAQAGFASDSALAGQQSQGMYSGQDSQLADYARKAGFPESQIPMAIAIMKAESGGNPTAVNSSNSNGSTDRGIFQINSVHSSWTKSLNLNDPYQNAKAAFKIYSDAGNSWKPWSTFNNRAYTKFLKQPASYAPAQGVIPPYTVSSSSGLRQVAVNTAMSAIGVPYVWGGNNLKTGVDCSGLVQQVYKSLGVALPRTADQQSRATIGTRTSIANLRPGDLVAWQGGWRGKNYVGHIAIYKGNGQIIEEYTKGKPGRVRSLKPGESAFGVHLSLPGD